MGLSSFGNVIGNHSVSHRHRSAKAAAYATVFSLLGISGCHVIDFQQEQEQEMGSSHDEAINTPTAISLYSLILRLRGVPTSH